MKYTVIKIGSAIIVDEEDGKIRLKWLDSLIDDIANLVQKDESIIIVSSGAVALGRKHLKNSNSPLKLEEKQAAAALGQILLINAYQKSLSRYDIATAQILLTIEDSENRRRYLNSRNTLKTLLKNGVVPIVNENDTVATDEIRVGDNDRLAARVAQMIGADRLILFSDVDGLYDANPKNNKNAKFIEKIDVIDDNIRNMADGKGSTISSGGMATKIVAAEIATSSGITTIISNGMELNPLKKLENGGKLFTEFTSTNNPISARKKWIANSLKILGKITIDDGAVKAIFDGKSILPVGVVEIDGDFNRGDAIIVIDSSGVEIARGLSAFSASDARAIMGKQASDIPEIVGYIGRTELIHRDDLTLNTQPN